MIDLILVKLFLRKETFSKYFQVVNLDFYKNNNKELFKVLTCLKQLHEKISEDASLEDLSLFFYTSYPLLKPEEKVLYDTIFTSIATTEVKEELAIDYLEKHRQQTLATEIALKALEVSRGKADMGTVTSLLQQEITIEAIVDKFVSDDLEELADAVFKSQGLRWRLDTMNKTLGSLRQGDFGFAFARPETGKTTFLASEITYMAQQAKEKGLGPVLWFNNEEQGSKVMLRCYQGVFGITRQELFTNLDYYKEEYTKLIGNHIKIYDEAVIKKGVVEKLCKEHNPSLIIFDQIDKIYWPDSERYDLKMKAIYQWGRELSKMYGPVIGICQAGGTGEGKKYLDMNDVDSSHTAKQGEADFMIGIGKTNNESEAFIRYLSICKNKLEGDLDSIPELRHGKLSVVIQPDIARYQDSTKWSQ